TVRGRTWWVDHVGVNRAVCGSVSCARSPAGASRPRGVAVRGLGRDRARRARTDRSTTCGRDIDRDASGRRGGRRGRGRGAGPRAPGGGQRSRGRRTPRRTGSHRATVGPCAASTAAVAVPRAGGGAAGRGAVDRGPDGSAAVKPRPGPSPVRP